ncbi:MAG: ABC transporter ATP-binding protein [Dehalococcoidia bacterium]
MDNGTVLVELHNVMKWFPVQQGFMASLLSRGRIDYVRAVDGVSFEIKKGEVFGLVGESGSGKTTIGRLVLRLLEPTDGQVIFDGVDLATLSDEEMRRLRSRMQIIFQDPLASLNPRMTIGQAIAHPVEIHYRKRAQHKRKIVSEMLEQVGLTPAQQFYDKYPHQLSGGQRQRVTIARALVTHPDLILADEPIAMADVSLRALLLHLLKRLKQDLNLTYLFITHDLATAKYICDRIGVMYLGKIVEIGSLQQVFSNPVHPYTRALLSAVPVPDPRARRTQALPHGEIPSPIHPPSGCHFHPRCPIAQDICKREVPETLNVAGQPGHMASCHLRTGHYQHLDPERPPGDVA